MESNILYTSIVQISLTLRVWTVLQNNKLEYSLDAYLIL